MLWNVTHEIKESCKSICCFFSPVHTPFPEQHLSHFWRGSLTLEMTFETVIVWYKCGSKLMNLELKDRYVLVNYNSFRLFLCKNRRSRVLCMMRLSPSFPKLIDSVFTLLSKYAAGIRCTVEMCLIQKSISDIYHTEDDDTNRSVSSIEDDFVTALEHLDEDDPTKICSG